ncbi:STAS domain-containing protein [Micromonospora sp. WMMD882]|uniref:STAS domain-containing protein n=1 Tax=Micromonospora sp. WMMD882 TaxID=3015151 RepID=UPI00248B5AF0|nr:STAS domain-containing protein [Micromonospora sp. WMMD882]WBB82070.1 STAS domain-containing protein [Micromonospora sp. WMMD882]
MELRMVEVGRDGVTLAPLGELDMATVGVLEEALTTALNRPGLRECVVDLAGVGFLDSTGLRALIDGLTLARERGVALRVTDPQPPVARVLRITSIGPLLGLPDVVTPDPPRSRHLGG